MGRVPAGVKDALLWRKQKVKREVTLGAVGFIMFVGAVSMASRSAAFDPPKDTPSLCSAREEQIFSCPIRGKIVSVCTMKDGKAAYRYGRPGRIELQSRDLHAADQGYSGGGEDQINFKVNGYTYIVFAKTERTGFGPDGHNDPQFTSGVVVQKNGRTVSSMKCGDPGDQPIDGDDDHYMPKGEFIPH